MISQIRTAGNPQAMLESLPQYQQVMDCVRAHGGDPQAAFYAKAQEMGINPDEILQAMRNA